jgi:phosphoserine phosphatase
MDVDSTFVKGEFIDELAELVGVKEQVAAITARAMRGEIDFKGALTERVKLLEGLPFERAQSLIDKFELTPGADLWVKKLQSLGFKIGLVSGGFTFFVDVLKQRFGLDFAFANELEVEGGKLTGRVRGVIVDSERKAQVLQRVEWMQGRKAQGDAALVRFPDAGAVGPFALGRNLRRPLLAPVV